MKKLAYLALFALLYAAEPTKQELIEQIGQLEKELTFLKSGIADTIDELSERIDENEFEASLNKIKWGGELRVNNGNYYIKYNEKKYSNTNKWDMKVILNMNAHINEKTKFTGRLMMTKAWGSSVPLELSVVDPTQGRVNGDSHVFLERAYVDYHITPDLVVTLGRQSTSDGPGMNLKYDTRRKATYPALLFNGAADGIVLTYKLKNRKIPNLKFRLAYGKGYQWQDPQYGWLGENPGIKDTDVYGFFIEGSFKSDHLGRNLWILTAVKTDDLITNPFDTNATTNQNLGDYEHYGVYFENLKTLDSKLNYFVSYAYCKPHGNGKTGVSDLNNDGVPDTAVKLLKKPGYAYQLGFRYDKTRHWKYGYEYNFGSKYWFSFSTNLLDPVNKLAIRGFVHDFYIMYKMDLFQYVRIGYTLGRAKYNFIGMYYAVNGEPDAIDSTIRYIYAAYDVRF